MPRNTRIEVHSAIHLVRIAGRRNGPPIFFDRRNWSPRSGERAESLAAARCFVTLLARSAEEYGAIVHAWSVEPNEANVVLQTFGSPLAAIMRRLCGQYAQFVRRVSRGVAPAVFAKRYQSKIVAPMYLPHAIRRVHRKPVLAGLASTRAEYPLSSERAYCGLQSQPFVSTGAMRRLLDSRSYPGGKGYAAFMEQDETAQVASLFERGSPFDARIVGDQIFVQKVQQAAKGVPRRPSFEELVARVAPLVGCKPEDLHSGGGRAALGRAVVASRLLRTGGATLSETARRFDVTPAALRHAINRYKAIAPDLFRVPGTR